MTIIWLNVFNNINGQELVEFQHPVNCKKVILNLRMNSRTTLNNQITWVEV